MFDQDAIAQFAAEHNLSEQDAYDICVIETDDHDAAVAEARRRNGESK